MRFHEFLIVSPMEISFPLSISRIFRHVPCKLVNSNRLQPSVNVREQDSNARTRPVMQRNLDFDDAWLSPIVWLIDIDSAVCQRGVSWVIPEICELFAFEYPNSRGCTALRSRYLAAASLHSTCRRYEIGANVVWVYKYVVYFYDNIALILVISCGFT